MKTPKHRSSARNGWGIYGAPIEERRAYMREAKRRSRAAIRLIDPNYDRSSRLDRAQVVKRFLENKK